MGIKNLSEASPEGWRGTVRAMLTRHPDKFSKKACEKGGDGDKLCPYAIAHSQAKQGHEPHYQDQPTSTKGAPQKKKKFREITMSNWEEWLKIREDRKAACQCGCGNCSNGNCDECSHEDCDCAGCECH